MGLALVPGAGLRERYEIRPLFDPFAESVFRIGLDIGNLNRLTG